MSLLFPSNKFPGKIGDGVSYNKYFLHCFIKVWLVYILLSTFSKTNSPATHRLIWMYVFFFEKLFSVTNQRMLLIALSLLFPLKMFKRFFRIWVFCVSHFRFFFIYVIICGFHCCMIRSPATFIAWNICE